MTDISTYQLLNNHPEKGLKQLYERYGRKLFGYAVKVWNCEEDTAWDLVYKTLYKIKESIATYQFENEEKFAAFVFTVFVNFLRNRIRDDKKKPLENGVMPLEISSENEETSHEVGAAQKLLNAELENLEDWQRMLLLLRSQGLSYAKIAEYTGRNEDQLKVYYGRLKKRLEQTLSEKLNLINEKNDEE